ncbi:MAG: DinB family protein [Anaerolineae bacterium]|nr:DinB family protein [Anaerolineae bacterium]
MAIDFKPVTDGKMQILEYSRRFTLSDLRKATNDSIDFLLLVIQDMDDSDMVFDPIDLEAHDPHAVAGEEHIGWNMGHLIAHVTASCEEWAAYSSILARSVAYGPEPRLRYETAWREIDTKSKAVQRLEESRRIRLAYLATWPDQPNLELKRELSPRFVERMGEFNAPACFLFGLKHEVGHYDQFREVARQIHEAKKSRPAAAAG